MSIEEIIGWNNFVYVFGGIGLGGSVWLFLAWWMNMIRNEGYHQDDKPQHSSKGYKEHDICDMKARSNGESHKPRQDSTAMRPFHWQSRSANSSKDSSNLGPAQDELNSSKKELTTNNEKIEDLKKEKEGLQKEYSAAKSQLDDLRKELQRLNL